MDDNGDGDKVETLIPLRRIKLLWTCKTDWESRNNNELPVRLDIAAASS